MLLICGMKNCQYQQNLNGQYQQNLNGCSNNSNLEMEAEFLTKNWSCLNLNISRTKNGRNKP